MNKFASFGLVLLIILNNKALKSVAENISKNSSVNGTEVSNKLFQFPKVCIHSLNISDTIGNFEKMACNFNGELSYDEGAQECVKHGMKLYKFDSTESYDGWFKLANSIFPLNHGAAVWVNGRRNDCHNKFKIVEDDEEQLILGNFSFRGLESDCGKCLRMRQNQNGGFFGMPWNCEKPMRFFCEFRLKEPSKLPMMTTSDSTT